MRRIKQYNDLMYESGPIKFNDFIQNNPNKIHIQLYNYALNKFIEHYCKCQLHKIIDNNQIDESIKNILVNYDNIENLEINNDIYNFPNFNVNIFESVNDSRYKYFYNAHNSLHIIGHEFDSEVKFNYNDYINDSVKSYKKNVYIFENYGDEYWKPSSALIFYNSHKNSLQKQLVNLSYWWNHTQDKNQYDIKNVKVINEDNSFNPEVKYLDYINGKATITDKFNSDIEFKVDFNILNEDTNISDEYLLNEFFKTKLSNK